MWHLEPSLSDPQTVFAGVEDAAIFKTSDGGVTWKELPGLREQQASKNECAHFFFAVSSETVTQRCPLKITGGTNPLIQGWMA